MCLNMLFFLYIFSYLIKKCSYWTKYSHFQVEPPLIMAAQAQLVFDEFGQPFIVMRDQENQKRLTGIEALKVFLIFFLLILYFYCLDPHYGCSCRCQHLEDFLGSPWIGQDAGITYFSLIMLNNCLLRFLVMEKWPFPMMELLSWRRWMFNIMWPSWWSNWANLKTLRSEMELLVLLVSYSLLF